MKPDELKQDPNKAKSAEKIDVDQKLEAQVARQKLEKQVVEVKALIVNRKAILEEMKDRLLGAQSNYQSSSVENARRYAVDSVALEAGDKDASFNEKRRQKDIEQIPGVIEYFNNDLAELQKKLDSLQA